MYPATAIERKREEVQGARSRRIIEKKKLKVARTTLSMNRTNGWPASQFDRMVLTWSLDGRKEASLQRSCFLPFSRSLQCRGWTNDIR